MDSEERNKQLIFALNTIETVADIPDSKRNDVEFLRGCLFNIKTEATAVLNNKQPAFYKS